MTLVRLTVLTTAIAALSGLHTQIPAAMGQQKEPPVFAEAISLFGHPLTPAPFAPDTRQRLEANLAEARAMLAGAPDDADAIIWVGRRLAYLGRHRDAIETFSDGIRKHPDDFRLYRHRGHRHITTRQFDLAIRDLERAASLIEGVPDEIEPDGAPNERNIPVSTSHTNIYYHLALAYYLTGDFDRALAAQQNCLEFSKNPDMQVATRYWLYLTLRRLDRHAEARTVLEPISADMDIIENGAYHRLLLMYKGELTPEQALEQAGSGGLDQPTTGYGVAALHLVSGRRDEAVATYRRILAGPQWAAFGYIAAEADLHRMGLTP